MSRKQWRLPQSLSGHTRREAVCLCRRPSTRQNWQHQLQRFVQELFVRACVRLQGVSNGTSFAPLPTRLSFLHVRQDESSSLTVCFLKLLVLKCLNKCRQTRAGYKSKQHLHTVMQSSANCAKNTAFRCSCCFAKKTEITVFVQVVPFWFSWLLCKHQSAQPQPVMGGFWLMDFMNVHVIVLFHKTTHFSLLWKISEFVANSCCFYVLHDLWGFFVLFLPPHCL